MTDNPEVAGLVQPDNLPTHTVDWGIIKWLVAPAITPDAIMSMGEVVLIPGRGHERHNHPTSEEILYVLSGEGEQMVDDHSPFAVKPGDTIFIPAGVYHSTINTGWAPLRLLAIYNPGGPDRDLADLPDFVELAPGDSVQWTRKD